jgi:hypothetical protein
MTDKIDPATLSGTELLLRQKHCPETLLISSPEALQDPVVFEMPSVHIEVLKASGMSAEELAEMIEIELRSHKIIELAKQAKKNKGK